MSYVDKNLTAGEMVVYRTRLHWISVLWSVIFAAIFVIVGLLFAILGLSDMKSNSDSLIIGMSLIVFAALLGIPLKWPLQISA